MIPTYTAAAKKGRIVGCLPIDVYGLLEEPFTRSSMTQTLKLSMFSFVVDSVEHRDNSQSIVLWERFSEPVPKLRITGNNLAVASQAAFGPQAPWLLHQRLQSCPPALPLSRLSSGVHERRRVAFQIACQKVSTTT